MNGFRLLAVGDFCSKNPNKIVLSSELIDLIDASTVKCINFEGPLATASWRGSNSNVLIQSETSPLWIENVGFNVVSLANNHIFDYGVEGLLKTKESFKSAITLGVGKWDEAYRMKTLCVNDVVVGFLSFTSADLSSLKCDWTDVEKTGSAWMNYYKVPSIIEKAKKQVKYLVITVHAGVEHMDCPLPEIRDLYRNMIDCGADCIIGSHPHVPQGLEIYKEKPIYYSLGNFCFREMDNDHKYPLWNTGMVALVDFLEDGTISASFINTRKKHNYIEIDHSKETSTYMTCCNNLLLDDSKYINHVENEVLKFYKKYETWLLLALRATDNQISLKSIYYKMYNLFHRKKNYRIALHQLREESTRNVLEHAYKIMSKTDL